MDGILTDATLRVRLDLNVMVLKVYSTLPESPELESHNQMLFSVIATTDLFFFCFFFVGVLTPAGNTASVF